MKKTLKPVCLLMLCCVLVFVIRLRLQAAIISTETYSEPTSIFVPAESEIVENDEPENVAGLVLISEVMSKNRTTPCIDSGVFDYVELQCCSQVSVDLNGWSLSQGGNKYVLEGPVLSPGERTVVFIDRLNDEDSFSLKDEEILYLYGPKGSIASSVELPKLGKNTVFELLDDGNYKESLYPTPGYSNTRNGYASYQDDIVNSSPLIISEAMVYNKTVSIDGLYYDWVELYNSSNSEINLSDTKFPIKWLDLYGDLWYTNSRKEVYHSGKIIYIHRRTKGRTDGCQESK